MGPQPGLSRILHQSEQPSRAGAPLRHQEVGGGKADLNQGATGRAEESLVGPHGRTRGDLQHDLTKAFGVLGLRATLAAVQALAEPPNRIWVEGDDESTVDCREEA